MIVFPQYYQMFKIMFEIYGIRYLRDMNLSIQSREKTQFLLY